MMQTSSAKCGVKNIIIDRMIYTTLHTHREEHHGDGEGDGGENSQSHDEQNHIKLVNFGVSVEQLGLNVNWKE